MKDWMWRSAVWQSLILGFSTAILSFTMRNQLPVVSQVFMAVATFNFLSLALLGFNRKNQKETLANWLYFLNLLFSGIAIGINQQFWLMSDKPTELFFGPKIMALLVAIQAPPRKWVGISCLLVQLIIPAILLVSWSPEQKSHLSAQEPWFTFTLILSSFFVYSQRLQTFELLQDKVRLETSVQEWKKFAQFLLGLQHLVNSPLQVIETAAALIEKKHPETNPWAQKIKEALNPLRRITEMLSESQKHLHWEEIQMSLSIEDLEKEMQNLSIAEQKSTFGSNPSRSIEKAPSQNKG